MVDFVRRWTSRFDSIDVKWMVARLGVSRSKFYDWECRRGQPNHHNGKMPRHFWTLPEEREAIVKFYLDHPTDGYRRCAYMMIDQDVAYCSPATVYRILSEAGVTRRWNNAPSGKKGKGYNQPKRAHSEWHIDISYINLGGTFYYLISVIDGFSRFLVHWDLRERMEERDVEIVLQRARELFPGEKPKIISDNGSQFVAREFGQFIRRCGMKHVRTSPNHPQSNGKKERWYKTLKSECVRPKCPQTIDDGMRVIGEYVRYYNKERLHSAIGYIAPLDKLEGRAKTIHETRDDKLAAARERRSQANKAKVA